MMQISPLSDYATVGAASFGVSISVQCPREYASTISAQLPVNSKPLSDVDTEHRFSVTLDSPDGSLYAVKYRSMTKASLQPLDSALRILQKEMHLCVAEHARNYVFIHAGVVECKGLGIVFPGSSYAGKSTLVWSLLQSGARYYSDEYAVFDQHGSVHPFTLPINLRFAGSERQTVIPERAASDAIKPDLIVFARYRRDATWRPRMLRPAECLLQLIRHSIAIRRNPAFVLPVLGEISSQSRAYMGYRGDCQQIIDWLSLAR